MDIELKKRYYPTDLRGKGELPADTAQGLNVQEETWRWWGHGDSSMETHRLDLKRAYLKHYVFLHLSESGVICTTLKGAGIRAEYRTQENAKKRKVLL